ncbi:MAG: hypothetical protein QXZ17_10895 [Nitrososphaerota archaeon]
MIDMLLSSLRPYLKEFKLECDDDMHGVFIAAERYGISVLINFESENTYKSAKEMLVKLFEAEKDRESGNSGANRIR